MQRTVSILALIVGDERLRLNLQNGIPVKCLQTHVAKAKTERIPSLISGAASMSMVYGSLFHSIVTCFQPRH